MKKGRFNSLVERIAGFKEILTTLGYGTPSFSIQIGSIRGCFGQLPLPIIEFPNKSF